MLKGTLDVRLFLIVETKGHANAGSVLKILTSVKIFPLVGSQITHGDSIHQKWKQLGINFESAFTNTKYLFPHAIFSFFSIL
ncbi:hypothetical protein BT93_L4822 [Corymbia citriodora subsp. variegata]|uniref:Uncharacterized protein n=1 Tax=Corymbia citriodora subsp. variegata TaxID=360336 RepID=A0A8T0CY30_CORYI|nr:hypothetical protein BT93_L4822 [Corymbia citriodora subsp. variegata]